MLSSITINDAQARELVDLLGEYGDGTDVTLTTGSAGGDLVVEFSLSTFTITLDGERVE